MNTQTLYFQTKSLSYWHLVFSRMNTKISNFPLTLLSDDILMKKISEGNEGAFQVLFNKYSSLILGYATRILTHREKAEDITQEIWIKVVKHSEDYRAESHFKSWLLTMTRNECLKEIRDYKKEELNDSDDPFASDKVQDTDLLELSAEELFELTENEKNLKNAIDQLPSQQRTVLLIWLTEELSYEEIAKLLKLSVSSVKSLLFRAKQSLEKILKGVH